MVLYFRLINAFFWSSLLVRVFPGLMGPGVFHLHGGVRNASKCILLRLHTSNRVELTIDHASENGLSLHSFDNTAGRRLRVGPDRLRMNSGQPRRVPPVPRNLRKVRRDIVPARACSILFALIRILALLSRHLLLLLRAAAAHRPAGSPARREPNPKAPAVVLIVAVQFVRFPPASQANALGPVGVRARGVQRAEA